jgi:hypothetical protein
LGEYVPHRHLFTNAINMVASVCQQDAQFWQVVDHD